MKRRTNYQTFSTVQLAVNVPTLRGVTTAIPLHFRSHISTIHSYSRTTSLLQHHLCTSNGQFAIINLQLERPWGPPSPLSITLNSILQSNPYVVSLLRLIISHLAELVTCNTARKSASRVLVEILNRADEGGG